MGLSYFRGLKEKNNVDRLYFLGGIHKVNIEC
jgi:hypothetical protein